MPVKLIIFDLDGTLIDSSVDIANALNYAMEPYSSRRVTRDETIKLVGEGISRLIGKLVGDRDETVRADVGKRFLKHYTEHIVDYTVVYPGVNETLKKLGRYRKAVISNKRESLSRLVLERLGLLKYFDLVIGSDTTPERKPSPVPVIKALSELHVSPDSAVMVGDSNYDVDAGKAAGVVTIAVTYGYRSLQVIANADHLIDRMLDLIPVLRRIDG